MKNFLTRQTLALFFICASAIAVSAQTPAPELDYVSKQDQEQAIINRPQLAAEIWQRTELYFGSAKPDGSVVTEEQYQQFVDAEVTPRFPDGLTVLTGYGQFRSSAGPTIKERSMVLILLYSLRQRDANRKIEEIRAAYKRQFQQESVLRVDSLAAVSF
jgi:ribosomal protein L31E